MKVIWQVACAEKMFKFFLGVFGQKSWVWFLIGMGNVGINVYCVLQLLQI